jgi:molybdopterin synthase catalytic subunit
MIRSLQLGPEPIDEPALVAARRMGRGMGAAISFSGVVRGSEDGAPISGLDYEAFVPMAEHQFHRLFDQFATRWPTAESVRLVHRLGPVKVVAPHRGEAFAACQWLIDEMKRVVPIWKKPMRD